MWTYDITRYQDTTTSTEVDIHFTNGEVDEHETVTFAKDEALITVTEYCEHKLIDLTLRTQEGLLY